MADVQETLGGAPIIPNTPQMPTGGNLGGGQQQNNQQQCPPNQGQADAPNFIDIARNTVIAAAISPKGSQYIKELKETISERASSYPITPKVITLPYPPETLCIYAGNNAFVLIFEESNRREENLPTVALEKLALTAMQSALTKNVRMWNAIIVTPQDYDKASVMGAFLVNSLVALSSTEVQSMTIGAMSRFNLEISTNPAVYENFLARYYPHGVADRADLKITLSLCSPKRTGNPANLFDAAGSEKIDIGVIGAYVVFTEAPSVNMGYKKFIPEVHISTLMTMVQYDGLIPLMLATATETLIDSGYWKTQFSDFGPNSPNIGNLIDDPTTGQPFRVENLAAMEAMIQTYCDHPVLILDVMEGRARIPGIEKYAMPNTGDLIIGTYNKFLGTNAIPLGATPPCHLYTNDYTGYINMGKDKEDSRWCSFLNMMIYHAQRRSACAQLLAHYMREEDNVNAVRQFFPDLELLYVNHMILLEPSVLRMVQAAVKSHIRTINGNQVSGVVDTAALLAAGKGFVSAPTGVFYGSMQQNPWTQLYGMGGNSMQPNLF